MERSGACSALIIGEGITGKMFCYQTGRPITGWAYKRGANKRHFTVHNIYRKNYKGVGICSV